MLEWFSSLPLEIQIILAALGFGLAFLAFLAGALVLSRLLKDVPINSSASSESENTLVDTDSGTEYDFEPEADKTYSLTDSPYPAEILVKGDVEDDEIYGDLIIKLPTGAKFVTLQRFYSDDYEEFMLDHFVIVYYLNGEYITQTWEGELYLHDYPVYPLEIIVREVS